MVSINHFNGFINRKFFFNFSFKIFNAIGIEINIFGGNNVFFVIYLNNRDVFIARNNFRIKSKVLEIVGTN